MLQGPPLRNGVVRGLLTVLFSSGMSVWAGLCASAPLVAYLATQPLDLFQVLSDWEVGMVCAALAFSCTLAMVVGFLSTVILYWRCGAMGLLFAAFGGGATTVTGFLVRGRMIEEAHLRAGAVEQAVKAIGLPLTDAMWAAAGADLVSWLGAMYFSIFTVFIDANILMVYLGFQLLVQAPLLFLMSGGWVGGVWVGFSAAAFLVQSAWKTATQTVGFTDAA